MQLKLFELALNMYVWDTAANILLSFDDLQHLFIHSYRWVRGVWWRRSANVKCAKIVQLTIVQCNMLQCCSAAVAWHQLLRMLKMITTRGRSPLVAGHAR